MENWLGSSLKQIQGWTTVGESYSRALEQGPLLVKRGAPNISLAQFLPSVAAGKARILLSRSLRNGLFTKLMGYLIESRPFYGPFRASHCLPRRYTLLPLFPP